MRGIEILKQLQLVSSFECADLEIFNFAVHWFDIMFRDSDRN
jgi:hypothetical protein